MSITLQTFTLSLYFPSLPPHPAFFSLPYNSGVWKLDRYGESVSTVPAPLSLPLFTTTPGKDTLKDFSYFKTLNWSKFKDRYTPILAAFETVYAAYPGSTWPLPSP